MTRKRLLGELEKLTHSARMRRMVEIGRGSRQDPATKKCLAELSQGDVYERGLALMSCYGSRDSGPVLRALADPSRTMRGLALTLCVEVCNDQEVQQVFELLSPAGLRRVLLRKLSKRRRLAAVDGRLAVLLERGDPELERLLSFGSVDFVNRALKESLDRGLQGIQDSRLARSHPDAVANLLSEQAAAAEEIDSRLLAWAAVSLPELSEKRPQRALEVVRQLLRHVALGDLPLQRLAQRLPAEFVDLLLEHPGPAQVNFDHVAAELDLHRLEQLIASRPELLPASDHWFRRLSPATRVTLYERYHRGWRDDDGCLPPWLIARLPAEHRVREARNHWNHAPLTTRPLQRIAYAGSLPFVEARTCLEPFFRNPDAELRAPALAALIATARYESEHLANLLAIVTARKNEQDPVRMALVGALAALPAKNWQPSHLDALGQVIRQALDAADLSYGTSLQIGELIVILLPIHTAWAVSWTATLVKERGQFVLGEIEQRLTDEDVRRMLPALMPVLHSWEARERQHFLISAAASLGMRLKVAPEIIKILSGLAVEATSHIAAMALNVIAQHAQESLPELIPKLLKKDPSWITQRLVYSYLHRRRQDLLTPFLGRIAYRGKFSTGRTRFVLPLEDGFRRWTASQQATFATTLEEVIRDADRDSPALLMAIGQIAALPAVTPKCLFELAQLKNKKLAIRDAALRALSRLDAGQGVRALLEAMEDDRARIAIYVLRRSALELPSLRAFQLLREVRRDQVTVAKEVIRLIGELKIPEAHRELLDWSQRELHRDVRVALLRGLWDYLDEDSTWPVLEQAASSPDPAIATIVGRIPAARASKVVQHRLVELMAKLLVHTDAKVRCDALSRCAQMPLSDTERVLQPLLLAALESNLPDEVQSAAGAVFATYTGRQASAVGDSARRLATRYRALNMFVGVLLGRLIGRRTQLEPSVLAILAALADAPLTIALRVQLAIRGLATTRLVPFLSEQASQLHPDAVSAAIGEITGGLRPASDWRQLETALAGQSDERLRRLAVAALVVLGHQPAGWTDENRAKLAAYQQDTAILVAAAAAFTFPPELPAAVNTGDA